MAWVVACCFIGFAVPALLGTARLAFPNTTTKDANRSESPAVESTSSPTLLFAEASKRSTRAHLLQLYSPLCRLATLPRKPPVAWLNSVITTDAESDFSSAPETPATPSVIGRSTSKKHGGEELDARALATLCLEEIGREIGVQ